MIDFSSWTRRVLAALLVCVASYSSLEAAQQAAAAPAVTAAPAEPKIVVLRLKNNTLLVGTVVKDETDQVVFKSDVLGEITIKKADIVAVMEPAAIAAAFQAPAAPPPPETQAGFTPPGQVRWTRTLTVGGSFTSGAFKQGPLDPTIPGLTGAVLKLPGNQYTAQGGLVLVRATNLGVAFVDASLTYAVYDPFGKQADLPKVSVGYNFRFKNKTRLYGVTKYTYYQDDVKHVNYSNQVLFGLGIRAAETPRLKLDLVPGLTLIKEDKGTTFDGRLLTGYGGLEAITFAPNPYSSIEQRETFYQTFNDSSYYGLESYIGFKGFLSKNVGLTIGFTNIVDNAIANSLTPIPANALFPGQPAFNVLANNRVQSLVTAGIAIKF